MNAIFDISLCVCLHKISTIGYILNRMKSMYGALSLCIYIFFRLHDTKEKHVILFVIALIFCCLRFSIKEEEKNLVLG